MSEDTWNPYSYPGLTNYQHVRIPGTDAVAYLGIHDHSPSVWYYSLWTENDDLVSTGELDLSGLTLTPAQVARVAFLLDVDYGDALSA